MRAPCWVGNLAGSPDVPWVIVVLGAAGLRLNSQKTAVDTGTAAIIAAIITGTATVSVALIVARTPKREVHEFVFRHPDDDEEVARSPIIQALAKAVRAVGWAFIFIVTFASITLLTMLVRVWMDIPGGPTLTTTGKQVVTVINVFAAALLFCIARWASNLLERLQAN
jgi:hypothetical protein